LEKDAHSATLHIAGQFLEHGAQKMKVEYKIKFEMPKDYDLSEVLRKLPSPISSKMAEIYNFSVEAYGFYFLDNLVDQKLAEHASELNANHTQIRSISVLFLCR